MPKLAKAFNKAIEKQINMYAAWFPVTNTFKIGDYGYIEDGVFRSIGNIADEYNDIEFKIEEGNPATINFVSSGTTTVKVDAEGNAINSFSGLGNAEAKLKIKFENSESCILKAEITSRELKNVHQVARKLLSKKGWKKRYKVVSTTYSGDNCVVICSGEAGTEVDISGNANILEQVEGGKVKGGLSISSNKKSIFDSVGETGVIGLGLFKLNWLGNIKLLDGQIDPGDYSIDYLKGDLEDDF